MFDRDLGDAVFNEIRLESFVYSTGAVTIAGGLLATSQPVAAANPHFIRCSARGPDNAGNLEVVWKEAGLGDNQNIDYEASANATAVYACINRGGKYPQATNKESFEGSVSATGTFSSGKNGQINGSLTLMPPESTWDCPPGQQEVLASVSYSNVKIVDMTNDETCEVPGSFSEIYFTSN
ncbi:hypothetical protein [Halogranum amylolyticum]|nr:hypothetical protein [Halogranum amylolyticum]